MYTGIVTCRVISLPFNQVVRCIIVVVVVVIVVMLAGPVVPSTVIKEFFSSHARTGLIITTLPWRQV